MLTDVILPDAGMHAPFVLHNGTHSGGDRAGEDVIPDDRMQYRWYTIAHTHEADR